MAKLATIILDQPIFEIHYALSQLEKGKEDSIMNYITAHYSKEDVEKAFGLYIGDLKSYLNDPKTKFTNSNDWNTDYLNFWRQIDDDDIVRIEVRKLNVRQSVISNNGERDKIVLELDPVKVTFDIEEVPCIRFPDITFAFSIIDTATGLSDDPNFTMAVKHVSGLSYQIDDDLLIDLLETSPVFVTAGFSYVTPKKDTMFNSSRIEYIPDQRVNLHDSESIQLNLKGEQQCHTL